VDNDQRLVGRTMAFDRPTMSTSLGRMAVIAAASSGRSVKSSGDSGPKRKTKESKGRDTERFDERRRRAMRHSFQELGDSERVQLEQWARGRTLARTSAATVWRVWRRFDLKPRPTEDAVEQALRTAISETAQQRR